MDKPELIWGLKPPQRGDVDFEQGEASEGPESIPS